MYDVHRVVAHTVEDVFAVIAEAERKVYARKGIVTAVCLTNSDGDNLYVGGAGERWSLYFMGKDGDVFARPLGDPAAEGTTPVIEEMVEDIENIHFVPRDVGERVVREWWRSNTLWTGVRWHYMKV
jgi:hypothetical protein